MSQDVYVTASRRAIETNVVPVADCSVFAECIEGIVQMCNGDIVVEHSAYGCERVQQVVVYVGRSTISDFRHLLGTLIPFKHPLPRPLRTSNGMHAYVFRQDQ